MCRIFAIIPCGHYELVLRTRCGRKRLSLQSSHGDFYGDPPPTQSFSSTSKCRALPRDSYGVPTSTSSAKEY